LVLAAERLAGHQLVKRNSAGWVCSIGFGESKLWGLSSECVCVCRVCMSGVNECVLYMNVCQVCVSGVHACASSCVCVCVRVCECVCACVREDACMRVHVLTASKMERLEGRFVMVRRLWFDGHGEKVMVRQLFCHGETVMVRWSW